MHIKTEYLVIRASGVHRWKTAQAPLGHSDLETTLGEYTHAIKIDISAIRCANRRMNSYRKLGYWDPPESHSCKNRPRGDCHH
jgi:hypothetical protein